MGRLSREEVKHLRETRAKHWRKSIESCPRCKGDRLVPHEDGLQCFNCFQVIYYPHFADIDAILNGCGAVVVKQPEAWADMCNWDKSKWYDRHKKEILADYKLISDKEIADKWSMSVSTFRYLRKRWGIPYKKTRKRVQAAVV